MHSNKEEEKERSYEERREEFLRAAEHRQQELRENIHHRKESKVPDEISFAIKEIEERLHKREH